MQLLQSGQAGGPNQAGAPVPQDVHPQAYQAAGVGAPPGPQWGAPAPSGGPPPQPPAPSGRIPADWGRANEVRDAQGPAQQPPAPFEQRENVRVPQPPQSSPRQEQGRQFSEQHPRPGSLRKGLSPSPKFSLAAPNAYQGPQILPQLAPPQQQQQQQQHNEGPPNGAGFNGSARPPPIAQPNGPAGPSGGPAGGQPPQYGRPFTPPTEIRPIHEERPTSPGSAYPPQYHHGPNPPVQANGGIAGGAPPPAAAIAAAEAAARERDERPPSSMKRPRDWESEHGPTKKAANEETRTRLDEQQPSRRVSPSRIPSPRDVRRRSSSEVRREDQRRTHDNYHPSEAAHHPPTLPSIQHMGGPKITPLGETSAPVQASPLGGLPSGIAAGPAPGPAAAPALPPKEERERKEPAVAPQHEPPARKMDVDEDYDDDGDEEKKGGAGKVGSPKSTGGNAGIVNGPSQPPPPKTETPA